MSLLDHGPDGKFIGYGAALSMWLPRLLHRCSGYWLTNVLDICIAELERKAAKELEFNIKWITYPTWRAEDRHADLNMNGVRLCQLELRKRDILIQAIKDIKAVK